MTVIHSNIKKNYAKGSTKVFIVDKHESDSRRATRFLRGAAILIQKSPDGAKKLELRRHGLSLFQKQRRNSHSIFDRAMAEFIAEGKKELAK